MLHNSNWILNHWMKGTTLMISFNMFPSTEMFLPLVMRTVWGIKLAKLRSIPKALQPFTDFDRSLASTPWTSWSLVAPLTPETEISPKRCHFELAASRWDDVANETHLKEKHRRNAGLVWSLPNVFHASSSSLMFFDDIWQGFKRMLCSDCEVV